jgi:NADH:ubiquinone oxidoreductase subunit 5 (subunit L)/multisubunit Na+/H+ antiporter MnhA subunit
MGFLYYLLGLHAHYEALSYLFIHALTKIFLFLTVGALMLYSGGCQDAR